jgi:hypothetical protein
MCLQVVLGLQLKVWLVYGNGLLPKSQTTKPITQILTAKAFDL